MYYRLKEPYAFRGWKKLPHAIRIGRGAQMALEDAGIKLFGGVQGSADAAVAALVAGTLDFDREANCDHHEHEHQHDYECGSHGCSDHHCGH